MSDELEGVVQQADEVFTEEALKANDGKTVPLRWGPGGPIIGEATVKYVPEDKALKANFTVTDPAVGEFLKGPMPSFSMGSTGAYFVDEKKDSDG